MAAEELLNQVSLVSESFITLRAFVDLLFGRLRHILRVVVHVLVSLQQLFLSEALVTLVALERLLARVYQLVRLQVVL